jgi:hypothetical protein
MLIKLNIVGITQMEEWYTIPAKKVIENGGASWLQQYVSLTNGISKMHVAFDYRLAIDISNTIS